MHDTPQTLAAAVVALQAKLPRITKGETATVRSDKGSYQYKYADLADVTDQLLPLMAEVGLAFVARPTLQDGAFVLAYSLIHSSGERENGSYPLPNSSNAQAVGSAITYARRYCLLAVTGAAPDDDDDAQAAMHARQAAPQIDPEKFAQGARRRIAEAADRDQLNRIWSQVAQAEQRGLPANTGEELREVMKARAAQITTTGEETQP